jgi:hypothetical protein
MWHPEGGSLPPEWVDECRDAAAFYFWVKSQDQEKQCLQATTHKGGLLSNKITISFVRLYIKHSCGSSGTASPDSPPLRLDSDLGPHVPRSSSMKRREDAKSRGPPFPPWPACAMKHVWSLNVFSLLSLKSWATSYKIALSYRQHPPVFYSLYLHSLCINIPSGTASASHLLRRLDLDTRPYPGIIQCWAGIWSSCVNWIRALAEFFWKEPPGSRYLHFLPFKESPGSGLQKHCDGRI